MNWSPSARRAWQNSRSRNRSCLSIRCPWLPPQKLINNYSPKNMAGH